MPKKKGGRSKYILPVVGGLGLLAVIAAVSAKPPPPTGCTKDSDCPTGQFCQNGQCVSSNQSAPSGTISITVT